MKNTANFFPFDRHKVDGIIINGEKNFVLPEAFINIMTNWMSRLHIDNPREKLMNYLNVQRKKRKAMMRQYFEAKYEKHELYRWIYWNDTEDLYAFDEPLPIWKKNTDEERDNALAKFRAAFVMATDFKLKVRFIVNFSRIIRQIL